MPGLVFEERARIAPSAPNRMDVALMVGFVRQRSGATLSAAILQWLKERGWTEPRYQVRLQSFLDIPIPLESWDQFDQLFAWEERIKSAQDGATYLGAAVRSFFAQGGRRCYVVRADEPLPLKTTRDQRLASVGHLLPGYPFHFDPSPVDRTSWSGLGHLFGLPDVSFVCLPDLPEAVSIDRQRVPVPDPPPASPEIFVECSVNLPAPPEDKTVRGIGAPRCDDIGYFHWAEAVNLVTSTLRLRNREAEFVAAIPLPEGKAPVLENPLPKQTTAILSDDDQPSDASPEPDDQQPNPTAFLQLVYPWIRTPGSAALAENLEPPDGALTGILARNALTRGTFSSAAGFHVGDIAAIVPQLGREVQDRVFENVCLFGPTPAGLKLLSDVTWSGPQSYRPGSVSRLIATLLRTARRIGEDITFEPLGERTWSEARTRLQSFLLGLFHAGALRGASPEDAFYVRCDRTTMTQNDLDEGRLIAVVQLDPAAPIDTITVVLVMNEDRQAVAPMSGVA